MLTEYLIKRLDEHCSDGQWYNLSNVGLVDKKLSYAKHFTHIHTKLITPSSPIQCPIKWAWFDVASMIFSEVGLYRLSIIFFIGTTLLKSTGQWRTNIMATQTWQIAAISHAAVFAQGLHKAQDRVDSCDKNTEQDTVVLSHTYEFLLLYHKSHFCHGTYLLNTDGSVPGAEFGLSIEFTHLLLCDLLNFRAVFWSVIVTLGVETTRFGLHPGWPLLIGFTVNAAILKDFDSTGNDIFVVYRKHGQTGEHMTSISDIRCFDVAGYVKQNSARFQMTCNEVVA